MMVKMTEEKKQDLELRSVYCLDEDEMKELDLEDWDELALFEGDPDYMDEPMYNHVWDLYFNRIYFFIWREKNMVIVSEEPENKEELLEFCRWQNTKVSISWTSTRSESGHWQYMDYWDNAWEAYEKNKNLKIAYRNGCWYTYTLFEYVDEDEQ